MDPCPTLSTFGLGVVSDRRCRHRRVGGPSVRHSDSLETVIVQRPVVNLRRRTSELSTERTTQ